MKLKLLLFNTVKVTSYNFISILLNPPIVLPITNIEGMNTFPLMGFFMEKVKGWLHLDSEKKQGWVLKIKLFLQNYFSQIASKKTKIYLVILNYFV